MVELFGQPKKNQRGMSGTLKSGAKFFCHQKNCLEIRQISFGQLADYYDDNDIVDEIYDEVDDDEDED